MIHWKVWRFVVTGEHRDKCRNLIFMEYKFAESLYIHGMGIEIAEWKIGLEGV